MNCLVALQECNSIVRYLSGSESPVCQQYQERLTPIQYKNNFSQEAKKLISIMFQVQVMKIIIKNINAKQEYKTLSRST